MRDFLRALSLGTINKKLTIKAMGISFFAVSLGLLAPQVYKLFFDLIEETLKSGNFGIDERFWILLLAYGLVLLARDFAFTLQYLAIVKWWVETKKELSTRVFSHLQSLSVSYFEKNSTGKIKERVDRGISDLNNVIEYSMMDVLPQLFYMTVAAFFLFKTATIFGVIFIVGLPLFILFSLRFTKPLIEIQDASRDAYEAVSGAYTEAIINSKVIKSYATENKHLSKIRRLIDRALSRDLKYVITRVFMNVGRIIIINSTRIMVLGAGLYMTLKGEMSIGSLVLAWTYTSNSIEPLWYLTRVFDNILKDMRSVRRVFELLDTKAEITDAPGTKDLRVAAGKIRFKGVSFSYEDRKIIQNFDLEIPSGKVVALVGKSGSGKTTLVKLLLRFYDVKKGNIFIDNQEIKSITQKSLRSNIGVVMQDSILFNDSVFKNIKYGGRHHEKSHIIAAAKVAHADDFIVNLPKKYNTVVGERGVKLSGGEQQRINIARALLKNPPILVLDEATSSLDSESEQKIQEALWKLIKGRTTIIIAHRLSTVMRADLIVVMDKGKIAESGTHSELVKKGGIYAKLFEIQSGGYES